MHLNKILSPQLHVNPLNEGEVAEFRLIGADRINPRTGQPMKPAGLSLPGESNIVDPHDGNKAKLIQNVISWRAVKEKDGSMREEPVIGRVRFGKTSSLKVTSKENETYAFLMRHDRCDSNPYRNKSKKAYFYLVNPRDKAMKIIHDEELSLDARLIIRNADSAELFAMADKIGLGAIKDVEQVRAGLIQRAKQTPLAIINSSGDVLAKSKIRIKEAIELYIIAFETKERVWFWADDAKHTVILEVPDNKDPLLFLVEYVQGEDGRKFYNHLLKKLKSIDTKVNGS